MSNLDDFSFLLQWGSEYSPFSKGREILLSYTSIVYAWSLESIVILFYVA